MSEYAPIGDLPHTLPANASVPKDEPWRGWPLATRSHRFFAAFLNYFGAGFVSAILSSALGFGGTDDGLLLYLACVVVITGANPWGFDLGKRIMGLRTVRPVLLDNGEPAPMMPGVGWSIVRGVCHIFDIAVFPIGVVLILLAWNRRSIADHVAGTVVIDVWKGSQHANILKAEPFPGRLARDRWGRHEPNWR